jgi:hypothetical protein
MMTFPTEWKVINFMFQTTNQYGFMMMILLVYQAYMGVPKMVKWNLTQSHQKGFNTNTNHIKFMFQTTNQLFNGYLMGSSGILMGI